MNPFNFRIRADEKEKLRRRILYSCTAVLLTAAFTIGFLIVYVNSYNMISPEPMEIFGSYRTDDSVGFVLFGHYFSILTDSVIFPL